MLSKTFRAVLWPWACTLTLLHSATALAQPAVPVTVAMPTAAESERHVALTGSFIARRVAALSPRVPGLVAGVRVDAGDRVTAGDVLLELDGRLAALAVARAEAGVAEQRAALAEAERLLAEAEGLVRDRFVPESEVKARASAVALAAAALDRARRDADAAREQLARHDLIAPFDGVIARKLTEAGEWVETGTPVLDLVDANHLWLDVRAPQQYWAEFGADAQVTVQVDALAGEAFNARVHARVPVSDPAARTFLVRLVVDAPPEAVTPGMSAQARFRLQGQGSVLRIPRDAIVRYPDGTTTVWAIDRSADGAQARQRAVTLARDLGEQVEIVGGIEAGVPVVVRGNERLREGQAVRIEP